LIIVVVVLLRRSPSFSIFLFFLGNLVFGRFCNITLSVRRFVLFFVPVVLALGVA